MTPDQVKAIEALAAQEILETLDLNQRLFVKGLTAAPDRLLEPFRARYLAEIARQHGIAVDPPPSPPLQAGGEAGAAEDAELPTVREMEGDPELLAPSSAAAAEGLPFHPLANLFPLIEGREFDDLVADIRINGLLEPIVTLDGAILDGRNRYRAALAAGVLAHDGAIAPGGCWLETVDGDAASIDVVDTNISDPLTFVLSKNLSRRHLSESQRAMVAAKLATMRQGERTDLASFEVSHGGAPQDGGEGAEPSASLPKVDQRQAAGMLNVSDRSLRSAKAVQEHGAAELQEAVRGGRASVSAAEALARLPVEEQQRILADVAKADDTKKAFAGVVKDLRREKQDAKKAGRELREADLGARQRVLPDRRYGVILADPEWRFEPFSRDTGMDRSPDNHYPTSPTLDIVTRPVGQIAADDCALFLWATAPMLSAALEVMAGWGFAYKTHLIWRKAENHAAGLVLGTGYWFRNGHEILLLGTKGSPPAPAPGDQWPSMFDAAPLRHSAKPDAAYELIEAYFPSLPKIELNARRAREGWDAWGLEAPEIGDEFGMVQAGPNHRDYLTPAERVDAAAAAREGSAK